MACVPCSILLAALGVIVHGGEWKPRLAAAFDVRAGLAGSIRLDAWLTPPAYTGKPPVMLAEAWRAGAFGGSLKGEIEVPQNAELVVRVNHQYSGNFQLRVEGDEPQTKRVMAPIPESSGPNLAEFRDKLSGNATVTVYDGGSTLASWTVKIIPDRAPAIALTEPVSSSRRNALHIKFHVEDDYGVASARASIDPAPTFEEQEADYASRGKRRAKASDAMPKRLGEAPVFPLNLPRSSLKSGDGQTYKDLTAHPWAGLPVNMTLIAEDQAGQLGASDAGRFILPEREFKKPLAKALIEQRKILVNNPLRPEPVARALDALTLAPETYLQNYGLFLGLRSVYWRLAARPSLPGVESAADQLWNIALKIEDGDMPEAERELRDAQDRLAKALEANAAPEEIAKLMKELREALAKFLETARKNAQSNENMGDASPPGERVTAKDLENMLKNIEDLAKTGSKDAARQMLAELRRILENAAAGRDSQDGQPSQMSMLDELSNLMTRQQQLLDETYRAKRDSQKRDQGDSAGEGDDEGVSGRANPRQGRAKPPRQKGSGQPAKAPPDLNELKERQQALRDELGELRKGMTGLNRGVEQKLDEAEGAMGEAGEALGQGESGQAAGHQTDAVDSLRAGAKALAEQMMQSREGRDGNQQGNNNSRDPLGRPSRTRNGDNDDTVKVPKEMDIQRAREILDELRRRLGERYRPELELEYLDRLIKRF